MALVAAPHYRTPTGKDVIYYHTSWSNYGRNFQVKDLPIDHIPSISYAFFNVAASGEVASGDAWADFDNPFIGKSVPPEDSIARHKGNFGQFQKLREAGKKFNLYLAIGGWTWSKHFSNAVSTPGSRQNMVDSIVGTFRAWPALFNGLSIDWEYLSNDGHNYGNPGNQVSKDDEANFVLFLKLLREALGRSFVIGFCTLAAPEKVKFDISKWSKYLDQLHIMTYDFNDGSWGNKVSAHHSNLRRSSHGQYSCEEAVDHFLKQGVPSTKIYIGVAFYSRGFANTDGIGKPCSGGSTQTSWEDGVCDYKTLPRPGATEMWDDEAKAGYSFDPKLRLLQSYDTPLAVKHKCQFVHDKNLGGVIVWESSADHPYQHARSLMRVMHDSLTHGIGSKNEDVKKPIARPLPLRITNETFETEIEALTASRLDPWEPHKNYSVADTFSYDGDAYTVLVKHTSQPDWLPGTTAGILYSRT